MFRSKCILWQKAHFMERVEAYKAVIFFRMSMYSSKSALKIKNPDPLRVGFFLVLSIRIEDVRRYEKALKIKAFLLLNVNVSAEVFMLSGAQTEGKIGENKS